MKVAASYDRTHNPSGESCWVSRLRENFTSGSYGEGPETGRDLSLVPRQSFTRQIYFKVLKSGCGVQELQFEKLERLEACLAVYMIIAWRVMFIEMLARSTPNIRCSVIFEDHEWKSVYAIVNGKRPPDRAPMLKPFVDMLASLGGYIGRKSDGPPGPKTIWIGLQRMRDFALATHALNKFSICV